MPEIAPGTRDIEKMNVVHLYHYAMSQCSQRVRICLEEKGVAWVSHHLDLAKGEHISETYRNINPNNLVPTLIHNGRVFIESTDIIEYIDAAFPGQVFMPKNEKGLKLVQAWLEESNRLKPAIKTLSFEFLFKSRARKTPEEISNIKSIIRDKETIEFHEALSSRDGFSRKQITDAIQEFRAALSKINDFLSKNDWLAGDEFSLADISWIGDVHRLRLMGFPIKDYPHLVGWYNRIESRPSFTSAVKNYEPILARWFFKAYCIYRYIKRSNIGSFL